MICQTRYFSTCLNHVVPCAHFSGCYPGLPEPDFSLGCQLCGLSATNLSKAACPEKGNGVERRTSKKVRIFRGRLSNKKIKCSEPRREFTAFQIIALYAY
jgi:hypothetical protein